MVCFMWMWMFWKVLEREWSEERVGGLRERPRSVAHESIGHRIIPSARAIAEWVGGIIIRNTTIDTY